MELVSIIIPVYNTASYLHRCLGSIKDQTYTNLEIILVDDGSTDRSGEICREYVGLDKRFKYYYQNNSGVSAARNLGLLKATGKYVSFVDSDDWVCADFIEELVEAIGAKKADIAVCGFRMTDGDNIFEIVDPETEVLFDKQSLALNFWSYCNNSLWNSPCNKLFLRCKIMHEFDCSMNCGEDMRFNMQYMTDAERIVVIPKSGYYYYKPPVNGVKYPKNDARQCFLYSESVREFLSSCLPEEKYVNDFEAFACGNMCRDVGLIAKAKPYKEAVKKIREFYEYPLFIQILKHRAWRQLGKKYRVMGFLLRLRMISAIIITAKLLNKV